MNDSLRRPAKVLRTATARLLSCPSRPATQHHSRMAPARTLVCVVAHPDDDAYAMAGAVASACGRSRVPVRARARDRRRWRRHPRRASRRPGRPRAASAGRRTRPPGGPSAGCPTGTSGSVPGRRPERVPFDELIDRIDGDPGERAAGRRRDVRTRRHLRPPRPHRGRRRHRRGVPPARRRDGPRRSAACARRRPAVGVRAVERAACRDGSVDLRPDADRTTCAECPTTRSGWTVDCSAVSDRIVAGLREHRSQHHSFIDDPDDVYRWQRIVRRSWNVVAWPPRPDGVVLSGVFDGLP